MTPDDYQQAAARTLIDGPDFDITPREIMIIWNAVGLAGEAGEIADLVKKGIFHQHGLVAAKVQEELGDLMWYVAALCTRLDISLETVMRDNIAKLEKRYPSGYSSEASKARVDMKPELSTDAIDWAQFRWDDRAECESCGKEIRFIGSHGSHDPGVWVHIQDNPRHPGWPKSGTLRRALTTIPGENAVTRASVRSPLPGDMAVCLHCQEQIRFNQFGKWNHIEVGTNPDLHEAEPHPF